MKFLVLNMLKFVNGMGLEPIRLSSLELHLDQSAYHYGYQLDIPVLVSVYSLAETERFELPSTLSSALSS